MNKIQRIILVLYLVVLIFLSVVYVPHTLKLKDRYLQYYGSLWSPRDHPTILRLSQRGYDLKGLIRVNISLWLMEITTLSIVCGILFILFKKEDVPNKEIE